MLKNWKVRTMGTAIGNVIGLIIVIILAVVAFFFPYGAAIAFVIIIYLSWLFAFLSHFFTTPKSNFSFFNLLSPDEIQTYRMFHLAILFPEGATLYSSVLNFFRLSGIIWGGICIWQEFYFLGTTMIVFYFVSSGVIVKYNPYLYLSDNAQRGNTTAQHELTLLQSIIEKRESHDENRV